ncbi:MULTISPECIES: hypothetical protein [unclassified Caballeronia]|uniref:hypothetical protein n=1 Tax=unclassified Caballeronia TaxID=2646786 RepID=UPI002027A269|nr:MULTISPECIES: hypothetical protein [unclassified Caballeronia]MDR5770114.1 hypothetical protein [Caballeronia sp. LZ028]
MPKQRPRDEGDESGTIDIQALEEQTRRSRREMVRTGKLINEEEFRVRLGPRARYLRRSLASGSIFQIEVDDELYFPAIFADNRLNLPKLHSICRILVPAPPMVRFHYLTSRRGNLGGVTPLSCLDDERQYRHLRRMAAAEAAGYSMTSVAIFAGDHIEEPVDVSPIYKAAEEVDPRVNLWKRCLRAITVEGYVSPMPPYPFLDDATIFVHELRPGGVDSLKSRLRVSIANDVATVTAFRPEKANLVLPQVPLGKVSDIKAAMLIIFGALKGGEDRSREGRRA